MQWNQRTTAIVVASVVGVLAAGSGVALAVALGNDSVSVAPSPSVSPSVSARPSGSATPSPTSAIDADCVVTYTVTDEWPTGFGASVTLTPLAGALTSWTVAWDFADGQTISQLWDGTLTADGAHMTVANTSYNAAVADGASVTFGFNGAWASANTAPTAFTLNGQPCAAGPVPATASAAPSGAATGAAGAPTSGATAKPATGSSAGKPATAVPASTTFYVNPGNQAATAAAKASGADKTLLDKIAGTPTALWVGSWASAADAKAQVADYTSKATAAKATGVLVIYAIPGRDCGSYSAGGAAQSEYGKWVDSVASGITGSPWVVLEPDALAQLGDCAGQGDRVGYLQYAAHSLAASGARVYLDAGNSAWLSADETAKRLQQVGFADVTGFALNTSNYQSTADSTAYGEKVSALLGGRGYVIDTSRNGKGSDGQWCNPSGRGLGDRPRVVQDATSLDALLWVKAPGESDGTCNGGPAAGQWWQAGALELARNAAW